MKWSMRQKVLLSALAAGLGLLAFDLLNGAPAEAEAVEDAAALAVAPSAQGKFEPPRLPKISLASKLAAVRKEDAPTTDPFSAGQLPAPPPPPPPAREDPEAKARAFERSHTLTAVMLTHKGSVAMINGKVLRVGQQIDGYQIIGIGKNSASLSDGKYRIELLTR